MAVISQDTPESHQAIIFTFLTVLALFSLQPQQVSLIPFTFSFPFYMLLTLPLQPWPSYPHVMHIFFHSEFFNIPVYNSAQVLSVLPAVNIHPVL